MNQEINKALEVLKAGGVILYPTDTIWGIGCDATSSKAVEKLYQIKQRNKSNPLSILVSNDAMINKYADDIPALSWDLIDNTTKPLTLIYPSSRLLASNVVAADKSIGIRLTKDPFCRKLIERFRKPITSTSANLSGEPSPTCFADISSIVLSTVDHVVNLRQNEKTPTASSIIKLAMNGEIKIIRQ